MSLQLFCLPYAGASAMVYARWRRLMPPGIELVPIELPGRGARAREALRTDIGMLVNELADDIATRVHGDYALFGHSLGGLVAVELAHVLRDRGVPPPRSLVVSGAQAPSVREDSRYRRPYSDTELIDSLHSMNGTPPEVMADAELLAMTLPVLRADFLLCGSYRRAERPPLSCRVHVLAGRHDTTAPPASHDWATETVSGCSLDVFDGDHFFIHSHESEVVRLIVQRLGLAAAA